MALVSDPGWILTKNSIIVRTVELFAGLSEGMRLQVEGLGDVVRGEDLPPNWRMPKISKGENYLGLPYVMLDYPRLFGKEDVLAIRTMFWWGHYFSVTLHLKGRYKNLFLPVIRARMGELEAAGFHLATSIDEWRHEITIDSYRALGAAGIEEIWEGHPFLKLSAKCGLDKWNEAPEVLLGLARLLINVLSARH